MFSIVEFFIDGGTIEIVPTQWLHSKESCWWPPTEDPEVVSRLVAKSAPVNESDWTQYSCKLLASFSSFQGAKAKLPTALRGEEIHSTTDIENRGRGKRKRRPTSKVLNEEEDDEIGEVLSTSSSSEDDLTEETRKKSSQKRKSGKQVKVNNNKKQKATVPQRIAKPIISYPDIPSSLGSQNLLQSRESNLTTGGGDDARSIESRHPVNSSTIARHTEDESSRINQTPVAGPSSRMDFQLPAAPETRSSPFGGNPPDNDSTRSFGDASNNVAYQSRPQNFTSNLSHAQERRPKSTSGVLPIDKNSTISIEPALINRKLDTILRNQEIIKATQREHGNLLDVLLKSTAPPEVDPAIAIRDFGLKLKTVRDVNRLERSLRDDLFKAKFISYLSGIGGSNSNVVGRILRRIMTNDLACSYCYKGQNGNKEAFYPLILNAAVIESVRGQKRFQHLTEDMIETKIKNWLKHAPSRHDDEDTEADEE